MSKLRSPWRDADARSLVRRAAAIEPAPAGARSRVFARVEAIVASAGGDNDASRDATSPPAGPLLPGGIRTLAIAAAFALGGGLGALVMYRVGQGPVRVDAALPPVPSARVNGPSGEVPTTARALPPMPPATQGAPPAESAMPVARERRAPAPAPSSPRASSIETPGPVADERTLLDTARVAVEREDGAAALAATEEHARRYPRGAFVQEREAIAVRALVLLGRADEARTRVDRFRERFPDSLLLPALESNVGLRPMP